MNPKQALTYATIAAGLIVPWEGLSLHAVPDALAGGLPTVCYGMTKYDRPVQIGDTYTREQCLEFLIADVPKYNGPLNKCIHVPISNHIRGAAVSLAYNVGDRAVCRSTFVRLLNAHDPHACDHMAAFNRAGHRVIKGLSNRRRAEIKVCYEKD
jgi:lysozyme